MGQKEELIAHIEFSKLIVNRALVIFALHLALTFAVIVFWSESGELAVSLMRASVPLYAVIFGGYFGKAGLENYTKIKNADSEVKRTTTIGSYG